MNLGFQHFCTFLPILKIIVNVGSALIYFPILTTPTLYTSRAQEIPSVYWTVYWTVHWTVHCAREISQVDNWCLDSLGSSFLWKKAFLVSAASIVCPQSPNLANSNSDSDLSSTKALGSGAFPML